jgi:hypothetical protein
LADALNDASEFDTPERSLAPANL